MNKTDVVTQVSQKTGFTAEVCGKVIKAFEEQSGHALENKLRGIKNSQTDIAAAISEKNDIAREDCEKIIAALDEVLNAGLSGKLKFFK